MTTEVLTTVEAPSRRRPAGTVVGGRWVARLVRSVAVVRGDARRWWLVAARPVSLRAWRRAQNVSVEKVPDRDARLRLLWIADNWTLGLLVASASTVLYLAAGGLRYLAGHPARRWTALFLTGGLAAGIYLITHTT